MHDIGRNHPSDMRASIEERRHKLKNIAVMVQCCSVNVVMSPDTVALGVHCRKMATRSGPKCCVNILKKSAQQRFFMRSGGQATDQWRSVASLVDMTSSQRDVWSMLGYVERLLTTWETCSRMLGNGRSQLMLRIDQ